jgi:uncharacterized integral membrane protein
MRPVGALVFALLAGIAAWLAVANRQAVTFSLDALRPGSPVSSVELPLFAVLLLGALVGLIVGALYMLGRQRTLKRAVKAERDRADRLQRLLADETLGRTAPPVRPQLSRISD